MDDDGQNQDNLNEEDREPKPDPEPATCLVGRRAICFSRRVCNNKPRPPSAGAGWAAGGVARALKIKLDNDAAR